MVTTDHLSNEEVRQMLLEFAGLFWRLEKYGYINANKHTCDESEENQCAHWRFLGDRLVKRIREKAPIESDYSLEE